MDFRLLFIQTCEDIVKRPLYLISAKITRLVTKISFTSFSWEFVAHAFFEGERAVKILP